MGLISNNIRFLRKKHGYTQEQLASRVGIKRSLLGAYEEDRAEVRGPLLEAFAKVFSVSINELTGSDLSGGAAVTFSRGRRSSGPSYPTSGASGSGYLSHTFPSFAKETTAPARPVTANPAPAPTPPLAEPLRDFAPAPAPVAQPSVPNSISPASRLEKWEGHALRTLAVVQTSEFDNQSTLVPADQLAAYARQHSQPSFLASLPTGQFPGLSKQALLRGFQWSEAFREYPDQTWFIASYVRNWLMAEKAVHVLVHRTQGCRLGLLENQLKEQNRLLLNGQTIEPDDLLELWKVEWVLAPFAQETPRPVTTQPDLTPRLQALEAKLAALETRLDPFQG